MKHFNVFLWAVIVSTVLLFISGAQLDKRSKDYTDRKIEAVVEDVESKDNVMFLSYEDLIEYVVVSQREESVHNTLLNLQDNTLLNLFSVCAKKYGLPLSPQELVDEYRSNAEIYNNLPQDSAKLKEHEYDVIPIDTTVIDKE